MTIIYRADKGAPLLTEEIDGNFKELETRLNRLEDHPEVAESIGKIEVQEDQMILTGTFGTDFGTFTLPKATLRLQAQWLPQTSYQKGDIVTYENTLYGCLRDHLSSLFKQDDSNWQEILSVPSPPSSFLPLYEKATLPNEETLGKLAILLGEEGPNLIFFNGKTWQHLMKGETV
ncbi:MAG: hypothetical protein BGO67_05740 [Alphaproteobacteria bacterium 41-28]|nr:MAG: hypothetical protein BGO67_05740 [Alphaproteobacteria bacterium 41-28]